MTSSTSFHVSGMRHRSRRGRHRRLASERHAVSVAAEMAYDEDLAHRVREQLADEDGVTEQQMFGGLAFLLDGNMAVVALKRRRADGPSRAGGHR